MIRDPLLDRVNAAMSDVQMSIQAMAIRLSRPDIPNVEDARTVEIGKSYFVSVATTRKDSPAVGASFPVLGDEHSDADYIPVFPCNLPHLHVDWRFIPSEHYAQLVELFLSVFGQNAEVIGAAHGGYAQDARNLQLACVLPASIIVNVQRWPLPCFRQQLKWEAYPGWLPNLEAAYKNKTVDCNRCPHRGIGLAGAPADENGVRVCPGHGLAWGKDGRLVSRTRE